MLIAAACLTPPTVLPQNASRVASGELTVQSVTRPSAYIIGRRHYPTPGKLLAQLEIQSSGSLKGFKSTALAAVLTDTEDNTYLPISFTYSGPKMNLLFETRENSALRTLRLAGATLDVSGFPDSVRRTEGAVEGIALAIPWNHPLVSASLVLLSEAAGRRYKATTDDTGRFRFDKVFPGSYSIARENDVSVKAQSADGMTARLGGAQQGRETVDAGTVYIPDVRALAWLSGLCAAPTGHLAQTIKETRPQELPPPKPALIVLSRAPWLERLIKGAGRWHFDEPLKRDLSAGALTPQETVVCVTKSGIPVGEYRTAPGGFKVTGAVRDIWTVRLVDTTRGTWKETTLTRDPPPSITFSEAGSDNAIIQAVREWLPTALAAPANQPP